MAIPGAVGGALYGSTRGVNDNLKNTNPHDPKAKLKHVKNRTLKGLLSGALIGGGLGALGGGFIKDPPKAFDRSAADRLFKTLNKKRIKGGYTADIHTVLRLKK